ncbi:MAG: S8 family serine peptidase [Verrucomicrobia bacterium]|nr:S8 family serine peptidase [Verrucomicrobiota bacterium]
MNRSDWMRLFRGGLALAWLATAMPPATADSLHWRKDQNRVDADIATWDLQQLLTELAAATDWQIFVQPDATRRVNTKFSDRTTGDALRLLLGDLNFALVPQSNGLSRLYVFRTSVQDATRQIHARRPKPIPRELIVTLKPGANIDEIARLVGAKIVGRIDRLNLYRLQFASDQATEAARKFLEGHDQVAGLDANYPVNRRPGPEELAFSSFPALNVKARAGGHDSPIIVGLIDTAIHAQGSPYADFLLPAVSVGPSDNAGPGGEALMHGDSMTQTLLRGLAGVQEGPEGSRVRILPVDIYGSRTVTSSFELAWGVHEALSRDATIINLSLSSDGTMPYLEQLIHHAHQQGVLFFAAAGNSPTTEPSYPAAYAPVIAVTAGNSTGDIASYANRGAFVDAIGPGSMIVNDTQGAAYLVSGTSVATAYAAGIAAGLAERNGNRLTAVEDSIRRNLAPKTVRK